MPGTFEFLTTRALPNRCVTAFMKPHRRWRLRVEHVAKTHIRKEEFVAVVHKERNDHPGLVHALSAMEACDAYEPWHDKQSHQAFLRHTSGNCLHYHFYWMDEALGLIYLRVP
jgi:hypothetical protein